MNSNEYGGAVQTLILEVRSVGSERSKDSPPSENTAT